MSTDDKKPPMPESATGVGKRPKRRSLLDRHKILETNATLLLIFSFLVVTVGGIVQIAPLFWLENTIEEVDGMRPYTPLELAGRDIYIREGCYVCHSQMIRPMRDEVERYGHYSLAAERCMTTRSSGARSGPGPTWPASAAAIRTSGTSITCATRNRWCRNRSCRNTVISSGPCSTANMSVTSWPPTRSSACPIPRR
jgi:hypothetical protein